MALLKHEVWRDADGLPSFVLAGPMGSDARAFLGAGAELVAVIEASSHFNAMSQYYELMGWGTYTTEHAVDFLPYPEEWLVAQSTATSDQEQS
jgi:hypothetical protein